MTKTNAEKILKLLRKTFAMPKWATVKKEPFETLIATIISQNTASKNTAKAFESLSKRFEITPEVLANAKTSQIEECLKVAGLYKNKAKTIKQVSRIILERFHGTLEPILSMPFEEARKALLQLPGVGPKTADVVLLFCSEKPTIPVDTHVNRISKRLGLAPNNGNYAVIRESLQYLYRPEDYLAVHVLLIALGRKYCKARNPLCKQCPLNLLCPSKQQ
ncbi:MAG: endonuclease III [Candidatus Bathyarchaeia archaeon]